MKVKSSTVIDLLSHMRSYFQGSNIKNKPGEEPFRSELFNTDQMETHAKRVATKHKLLSTKPSDKLLKRLNENEKTLLEVRNLLVENVKSKQAITPGGEWLLDNFYLIEEQIVIAKKHLPKGYSEGLPYLAKGLSAGMPRVYDIILEIISHSDGQVDTNSLSGFIAAYQTEKILTIGELWAIPIMLRLAVVENLRRVSERIALDLIDHNLADYWAEKMTETVQEDPGSLVIAIADMARTKPPLTSPFVAGFIRKLQGKGPALALPLNWMEQQLSRMSVSSNDLIWLENQKQAADQVSVRNSIGTLRSISSADWREFVETLSSMEQVLRLDPAGTYPLMDFTTRDMYRHVIEKIAGSCPLSETEVAKKVLELAQDESNENKHIKYSHVGYYLIDKGLKQTEKVVAMQRSFIQKIANIAKEVPVFLYLFSIISITIVGGGAMFYVAYEYSTLEWEILIVIEILCFAGFAQLAISLVNWLATILVRPRLLPRLDFSNQIPSNYQTLVVIPTLLTSKSNIEELIEDLEVRYLANPGKNLFFALLTDFPDADAQTMPSDERNLSLATEWIAKLNKTYQKTDEPAKFYLFHRSRKWNPKEGKWMGYERKRGKLSALNALLRGSDGNEFSYISEDYQKINHVKYIITLDSDTQLPREAAWKAIATMAHPLNNAIYDPLKKRVTEGYGILQPRVTSSLPYDATSIYLRLQGDLIGIDPYTRASSDVYQDLFGEGSFIGKGIYDLDVFEKAIGNVFQENRILSHDLLEGCYTRSGLISDVVLYEHNPSDYETDMKRQHRWIRGDWQIGAWMMPYLKNKQGQFIRNKLSTLSRWKIFDNLRRSFLPLSLLGILLFGWSILPFPWFWTLSVTFIVLLPVMANAMLRLIRRPENIDFRAHVHDVVLSVRDVLTKFMFDMAVLPYKALKFTDAIFRTNWRMVISGRKLLEWVPSSTKFKSNNFTEVFLYMWIGPVLSLVLTLLFLYSNHPAFYVASPILILWFISPALVWRVSLLITEGAGELNEDQLVFLRKSARKTWSFFQDFVNENDNWLPPDNFQEQPEKTIAHRTSPTNIGLALLANLTAYDFGYIATGELINRCKRTLHTLGNLERYQGHFYNWYDTLSISTLQPRYISTVDSGNLIGFLLTLKQGLLNVSNEPIFNIKAFEGLRTTVQIVREFAPDEKNEFISKISSQCKFADQEKSLSLKNLANLLKEIGECSKDLLAFYDEYSWAEEQEHERHLLLKWCMYLNQQIQALDNDLHEQAPWIDLLPVPERFDRFLTVDFNFDLASIQQMEADLYQNITAYKNKNNSPEETQWLNAFEVAFEKGFQVAEERINTAMLLAERCEDFSTVNYDFLYDKPTKLLRIGFNVDEQRVDDSYYDMLASESRLAIYIAISQGKIPQESWFSLGRLLTNSTGGPILLSWSGSMFEYLMPQLIMPTYENTLLHQTNIATVKRQIEYAKKQGVPWGISESGYHNVDANLNYQYHAFGVPGLGLKRGLVDDLVIAPYASMLALMVSPEKAYQNMHELKIEGFEGEYGYYEAIDYTASRVPRGKHAAIVYSYMAHHQGMGFLSLGYVLQNKKMQERFISELRFQASLLLLQERIPKSTIFYAHTSDTQETHPMTAGVQVRSVNTPNTEVPELQLLSNGNYQVMITNSGGGYSRWRDISVTRWREDVTLDSFGTFCYIKDVASGKFWSNTHHPTGQPATRYEVVFSHGHAEFYRHDFGIDTKTEVVVSPEDDTEMRKIRITNRTQDTKVLEITSYTEVVLANQAADIAHPAFSNLFVQTEILPQFNAIISTRRPRSSDENPPYLFHLMDAYDCEIEQVSYETDRMEFIGRGRNMAHPLALEIDHLSGKDGSVLDPIMSIRYRIKIKPNQSVKIDLVYGISETREATETLMHKYRDRNLKKRAFELSWTHSQVLLRQINANEEGAQLYGKLAGSIIYSNPALRADSSVINNNFKGQSGLWSYSISGDLPIVLLKVSDPDSVALVRQLIQAHAFWQLKGLAVDLVIWNEDHGSYRHELQDQITGMISSEAVTNLTKQQPGNIFVKSLDQVPLEDRTLIESVAKVIITDTGGTLAEQINRHQTERILPPLMDVKSKYNYETINPLKLPTDLLFYNGTGGFTSDGTEYKILIEKDKTTPAPWTNIIANPSLGTVVSESGSAYTWAVNAHEYRLTPWANDPTIDAGGEAFYIRDEETGQYWSPSPYPCKGDSSYITTHGFGYSQFEHQNIGIRSEMTVFVDPEEPVKFVVIKLTNQSGRPRSISLTGYLEIILGDVRSKTNMHILSEHNKQSGALLFKNRYNSAFAERVTFFKVSEGVRSSFTTDRSEFIGRNRNLSKPQILNRKKLSGRIGSGMDTCGALQIRIDLADETEKEIVFQIGNGENAEHTLTLLRKFTDEFAVQQSLEKVKAYWTETLSAVQVQTPDQALNLLANGWLSYQTIASRLFAKSGFYQSGGAFGFRDQLQDVLALLHVKPEITKNQILLNASRQFIEGDVQHWWHPPEGRGVRTRCSDDLLWLPYAVSKYVTFTNDTDILKTSIGYLESRLLYEGEDSLYDLPIASHQHGDLYDHCKRAISHSLRFGEHGLPLIGSGDWNDGMDMVGHKGKGESVWLAFFFYDVLIEFSEIAFRYGDEDFSVQCTEEANTLQANIEKSAWDGDWYKRAWFDDGTPLGSKENDECRIDAISQSWSVLSKAGSPDRTKKAMTSLNEYLVKEDMGLIQLLDPPFDKSALNPGYIKGYVPGVRENGGQYTHAAVWTLMAFAKLKERERVYELFKLLQPINHSLDAESAQIYKVEPYVIAADVYANESHQGRGGWTWYTGSAGWMYQFIVNDMIGLSREGNVLELDPCFPTNWPSIQVEYRYLSTVYHLTINQTNDIKESYYVTNNQKETGTSIKLADDGKEHLVDCYIAL